MATILHIHETDYLLNSRDFKEAASALSSGLFDKVILLGRLSGSTAPSQMLAPGLQVVRLPHKTRFLPRNKVLAILKIAEAHYRFFRAALAFRPDVIHSHGLQTLRCAQAAARRLRVPLVYDAHELETERNGLQGIKQRIERWTERRFIRSCDAVLVVSEGIADWYERRYGIERPAVVRNIPDVRSQASPVDPNILREKFNIPESALVFIYQGGLSPGRRIEQLTRVFAQAGPSRNIVFMGCGELEACVRSAASRHPNIHFLPAVPPEEVLRHTAGADVGLVGVEKVCLSYYWCLPNKFFEFLLAGIPVMANDWPEMSKIVREHHCGWLIGESEADWLDAVRRLDRDEVKTARVRAAEAAKHFSWANEEKVLLSVYRRVLGAKSRG